MCGIGKISDTLCSAESVKINGLFKHGNNWIKSQHRRFFPLRKEAEHKLQALATVFARNKNNGIRLYANNDNIQWIVRRKQQYNIMHKHKKESLEIDFN